MNDSKPYLIRALYEWICDNDCTPYLYVNTAIADVLLPEHLYQDNPLVLNISTSACNQLLLANHEISLQARFSGHVFTVHIPINAVMGIVARENGQGMTFEVAVEKPHDDNTPANKKPGKKQSKSHLKVIK